MVLLEMIELRSAGNGIEQIKLAVQQPILESDRKRGLKQMTLFYNASVDSYITIHLQWEISDRPPVKSDLGLRLAAALLEFGRIYHSLWIKDEG